MIDMRFRLPDLMAARGLRTAYALMKASNGSIPMTTANRLVLAKERPKRIDMDTLDALCDLFGIEPGELFERDTPAPKPKRRR